MSNILKTPQKPSKQQRTQRRRRVIIIISIVGLIVLIAGSIWWWQHSQTSQEAQQAQQEQALAEAQELSEEANTRRAHSFEVTQKAESAMEAGDTAEVAQLFDEAVDQADSRLQKADLLSEKAMAFDRMGDYQLALEAGLAADELDEDEILVLRLETSIARWAEETGDKELALEYYQRAYQRVLQTGPVGQGDPTEALEAKIAELEEAIEG